MLIFIVDDETVMLNSADRAIRTAKPDAEIMSFSRAEHALRCIKEQSRMPDVVFSDIRMPGLSGLEFAAALRTLCPTAKIIFVTGYQEYTLEAFRIHAHGYIVKPLEPERVLEELDALELPYSTAQKRLTIRCFGYFEVFWNGRPLHFNRARTKELLAYLINREGDACTAGQIGAALWEDESDKKAINNRIRVLLADLRGTLRNIGMEDLLIRGRDSVAINRSMVDCDYYRMLDGDVSAVNLFYGQYMQQYSWADLTAGRLFFRAPE